MPPLIILIGVHERKRRVRNQKRLKIKRQVTLEIDSFIVLIPMLNYTKLGELDIVSGSNMIGNVDKVEKLKGATPKV